MGLGLCRVAISAGMFLLPEEASRGNPALELMQQHAGYATYMKVSVVLGLIATGVLLAGGAGLLTLRPWGRTVSSGASSGWNRSRRSFARSVPYRYRPKSANSAGWA
jgi:hypothetical protein